MGSEFKVGDKAPTLPELDVGANDYNKSHDVPDPQFQDPIPIGFEALNNYHELKRSHMNAVAAFYHPLLLNGNIPGHVTTYLPASGMKIADNPDAVHVTLGMISTARKEVLEGRIRVTYIDADILSDVDPRTASNLREEGIDPSAKKDQTKKAYYEDGHWYDATPGGTLKDGEYTPNSGNDGYAGPTPKAVHYTVVDGKIRRETPQAHKDDKVDLFDAESGKAPMGKVAFDAVKALLESPPKELAKPGEWDGYYDVDMAAALAVIKATQSGSEPVEVNLAAFLDVPGQLTQTLIAIACFGMLNAATAIDLLTGKVVFATKAAAKSAVGKIAQMNEDKYVDPLSQTISFYTHGQTSKDDKTDDFYASAAWGWGALEALSTPEEWIAGEASLKKSDYDSLEITRKKLDGTTERTKVEFGDWEQKKASLIEQDVTAQNFRVFALASENAATKQRGLVEIDAGKGQDGKSIPLSSFDQIDSIDLGDNKSFDDVKKLQEFIDSLGEQINQFGMTFFNTADFIYLTKTKNGALIPVFIVPRAYQGYATAPYTLQAIRPASSTAVVTDPKYDYASEKEPEIGMVRQEAYLTFDQVEMMTAFTKGILNASDQDVYVSNLNKPKLVEDPETGEPTWVNLHCLSYNAAAIAQLIEVIDKQLTDPAAGAPDPKPYPADYYKAENQNLWLPQDPYAPDAWDDPFGKNDLRVKVGDFDVPRKMAAYLANVFRVYLQDDKMHVLSQAEALKIQQLMQAAAEKSTFKMFATLNIAGLVGGALLGLALIPVQQLISSWSMRRKYNLETQAMVAAAAAKMQLEADKSSEDIETMVNGFAPDVVGQVRAEMEANGGRYPGFRIGRTEQLRTVLKHYAGITFGDGSPTGITIHGEGGTGKTQFFQELGICIATGFYPDGTPVEKEILDNVKEVRLLRLNDLKANAVYQNQEEGRLKALLNYSTRHPGTVFIIDEAYDEKNTGASQANPTSIITKLKGPVANVRGQPEYIKLILGMPTRHKNLFFQDPANPGQVDEQVTTRYQEIPKGGLGNLPDDDMQYLLEDKTKKKIPGMQKEGINTDGLTLAFYHRVSAASEDYLFGGNPRRGMLFLGEYLRDCESRARRGESVSAGIDDFNDFCSRRPNMSLENLQNDIKTLVGEILSNQGFTPRQASEAWGKNWEQLLKDLTRQRDGEDNSHATNRLRLIQLQLGMLKNDSGGIMSVEWQKTLLQEILGILQLEVPENEEDLKALKTNRYSKGGAVARNPNLPEEKRKAFLADETVLPEARQVYAAFADNIERYAEGFKPIAQNIMDAIAETYARRDETEGERRGRLRTVDKLIKEFLAEFQTLGTEEATKTSAGAQKFVDAIRLFQGRINAEAMKARDLGWERSYVQLDRRLRAALPKVGLDYAAFESSLAFVYKQGDGESDEDYALRIAAFESNLLSIESLVAMAEKLAAQGKNVSAFGQGISNQLLAATYANLVGKPGGLAFILSNPALRAYHESLRSPTPTGTPMAPPVVVPAVASPPPVRPVSPVDSAVMAAYKAIPGVDVSLLEAALDVKSLNDAIYVPLLAAAKATDATALKRFAVEYVSFYKAFYNPEKPSTLPQAAREAFLRELVLLRSAELTAGTTPKTTLDATIAVCAKLGALVTAEQKAALTKNALAVDTGLDSRGLKASVVTTAPVAPRVTPPVAALPTVTTGSGLPTASAALPSVVDPSAVVNDPTATLPSGSDPSVTPTPE